MHRHLPEGLCLPTVQSGAETGGFHGVSVLVRLLVPASPSRSDPGRLRQKARSRTAREVGPTAMNLVAKLTLILFLSPQNAPASNLLHRCSRSSGPKRFLWRPRSPGPVTRHSYESNRPACFYSVITIAVRDHAPSTMARSRQSAQSARLIRPP